MQLVMRTAPRRQSYAYSRCIIYAQEFYASSIRCSCSKPRLDLKQYPPSLLVNEEFGETPPRPEGGMMGADLSYLHCSSIQRTMVRTHCWFPKSPRLGVQRMKHTRTYSNFLKDTKLSRCIHAGLRQRCFHLLVLINA